MPTPFLTQDTQEIPKTWEPFAAIAVAVTALFLSACAKSSESQQAVFSETKAECASSAVPNSYVVHWRDGSVSVERGYTREDFKERVFEPNKEDILLAEQDQKVRIHKPAVDARAADVRAYDEVSSNTAAEDQWGQSMIAVADAWNAGIKGAGVTVAVVDSGVDITHPLLAGRLATNAKEIPGNGIDDDGNGYVDDIHGWDFDGRQPIVSDTAGHGTHVAGIILAEHGASAVKGVAPEAKLLPLDFMDADGQGNIGDAILAIHYAVDQGAKVINASWGGSPCSKTLNETIAGLEAKGVIFVAAAGNSGVDLEQLPEYPAAFLNPTQITVGASTARDYTAGFSNYSYHLVHLFAPGSSILSTYPNSKIATLSGTSMAAPFVAGAAALLFSAHPEAKASEVRDALFGAVDRGNFAAITKGRLNVKKALGL